MSYKDIEDNLSLMECNDISDEIISTVQLTESKSPKEDRVADYELIRSVLADAMNKSSQALQGSLQAAEETKHPRAYEVVGGLAKTVSGVAADLMNLHKSMSDITIKEEGTTEPEDSDNPSVFTGTAGDLISILDDVQESKPLE